MRVRLTYGRQAGEVVDLLPLSARAMLADGRAVPLHEAPSSEHPSEHRTEHPPEQVAARTDRGLPRHKRRAVR